MPTPKLILTTGTLPPYLPATYTAPSTSTSSRRDTVTETSLSSAPSTTAITDTAPSDLPTTTTDASTAPNPTKTNPAPTTTKPENTSAPPKPPFTTLSPTTLYSPTLLLSHPLANPLLNHLASSLPPSPSIRFFSPLATLIASPSSPILASPGTTLVSDGEVGVDDTFTLHDGVMVGNVGRRGYEGLGVQGTRLKSSGVRGGGGGGGGGGHTNRKGRGIREGRGVGSGSGKGERWRVELDLRKGGRGVEKAKARVKDVWSESREWVGTVSAGDVVVGGEVEGWVREMGAEVVEGREEVLKEGVSVPEGLLAGDAGDVLHDGDEETAWGVAEWVDLVAMGSERVMEGKKRKVDPFVCRYEVPGGEEGVRRDDRVVVVKWKGWVSGEWCRRLVVEVVRASRTKRCREEMEERQWAVVRAVKHPNGDSEGDGCVVVLGEGGGDPKEFVDEEQKIKDGGGADEMDVDAPSSQRQKRAGLQSFMSFQMVDSRL